MDTNYFICTLGQAAQQDVDRPFHDIGHLIDVQALHHADAPAVGFYISGGRQDVFENRVITFKEVRQGVFAVADTIARRIKIPKTQTVGLLCNSSPAFLFTWLGLIRLGHAVLLIAPQCSATAIAHLSKACSAPILFHDDAHDKLAHDAIESSIGLENAEMQAFPLPFEDDEEIFKLVRKKQEIIIGPSDVKDTDVAYLHHTSGTSTGIPKPIPQTHKGGIGVLPALDGSAAATFTTTPLYHGGVADLFRAWTSKAMIYLFPSQHFPITAKNVVKCLNASAAAEKTKDTPPIKYFSSVPYILQMMAQDESGLQKLQQMDIVGVGGAALPPEVGDALVNKNVNLVSRYGSAECGFLMSSHRDYEKDKQWQYLRRAEIVAHLKFEKQEDGLRELIILSGWPHMAKTNRDDGSFATSDLFAPHPTIRNAWKYHSRADSQLTLITGKKFDPAPLEGSLAASSPLLSEVLIFGNGKPYPGALLFRSENAKDETDANVIGQLAPIVEKLNIESQTHARIPRNMLIPMNFEISPFEKSSKGTILRSRAEDKFGEKIESAYSKTTFSGDAVEDNEIPEAISRIVGSVVGDRNQEDSALSQDTNLFAYGVDSVACVQIRHALSQLLPKDSGPLPLTIVEDSGTISGLSETIVGLRRGQQKGRSTNQSEVLRQVIDEYSSFTDRNLSKNSRFEGNTNYNVILTGPTGLLGAHILSQLLANTRINKIFLLVRGATVHAASERVIKSLQSRRLPVPSDFDQRVKVMPCKISDPRLGLSEDDYQLLVGKADTIFHLAWTVNFLVSLRSLATVHLAGLQNLLNLALASKRNPDFLFCSSVASISNLLGNRKVPESISDDVSACGATGYSQSKLAAEVICAKYAALRQPHGKVTILRVGQLSGDTQQGVWNISEAYPLMLASSTVTGVLPDLSDEVLGWLPVDMAAKCYIEAALTNRQERERVNGVRDEISGENHDVDVLHLLNTSKSTTFNAFVECMQKEGEKVKIVPVEDWLTKLEQLQENERTKHHPALKLLPFWKDVYASKNKRDLRGMESVGGSDKVNGAGKEEFGDEYEMQLSKTMMPSLETAIGPLSERYLLKLWHWIKENVK